MTLHPIETILVNGVSVNKGALRDYAKRLVYDFGDAGDFHYSLAGVETAIIEDALYTYDASDLVSADNGTTCIYDLDERRFRAQHAVCCRRGGVFRATAQVGGLRPMIRRSPPMGWPRSRQPQLILVVFASSNSGAMTIKWDAQAAQALKSPGGSALANGEVLAGRPISFP